MKRKIKKAQVGANTADKPVGGNNSYWLYRNLQDQQNKKDTKSTEMYGYPQQGTGIGNAANLVGAGSGLISNKSNASGMSGGADPLTSLATGMATGISGTIMNTGTDLITRNQYLQGNKAINETQGLNALGVKSIKDAGRRRRAMENMMETEEAEKAKNITRSFAPLLQPLDLVVPGLGTGLATAAPTIAYGASRLVNVFDKTHDNRARKRVADEMLKEKKETARRQKDVDYQKRLNTIYTYGDTMYKKGGKLKMQFGGALKETFTGGLSNFHKETPNPVNNKEVSNPTNNKEVNMGNYMNNLVRGNHNTYLNNYIRNTQEAEARAKAAQAQQPQSAQKGTELKPSYYTNKKVFFNSNSPYIKRLRQMGQADPNSKVRPTVKAFGGLKIGGAVGDFWNKTKEDVGQSVANFKDDPLKEAGSLAWRGARDFTGAGLIYKLAKAGLDQQNQPTEQQQQQLDPNNVFQSAQTNMLDTTGQQQLGTSAGSFLSPVGVGRYAKGGALNKSKIDQRAEEDLPNKDENCNCDMDADGFDTDMLNVFPIEIMDLIRKHIGKEANGEPYDEEIDKEDLKKAANDKGISLKDFLDSSDMRVKKTITTVGHMAKGGILKAQKGNKVLRGKKKKAEAKKKAEEATNPTPNGVQEPAFDFATAMNELSTRMTSDPDDVAFNNSFITLYDSNVDAGLDPKQAFEAAEKSLTATMEQEQSATREIEDLLASFGEQVRADMPQEEGEEVIAVEQAPIEEIETTPEETITTTEEEEEDEEMDIVSPEGDPWEYVNVGGVYKTRKKGDTDWIALQEGSAPYKAVASLFTDNNGLSQEDWDKAQETTENEQWGEAQYVTDLEQYKGLQGGVMSPNESDPNIYIPLDGDGYRVFNPMTKESTDVYGDENNQDIHRAIKSIVDSTGIKVESLSEDQVKKRFQNSIAKPVESNKQGGLIGKKPLHQFLKRT